MKIEGVPEGWELVRLGPAKRGEWVVGSKLEPKVIDWTADPNTMYVIIRRIEPVCTWQHGVFADGWITEDKDGTLSWIAQKPIINNEYGVWKRQDQGASEWMVVSTGDGESLLLNSPMFRSDLPWTERIQQVGPTVEATLRGEG